MTLTADPTLAMKRVIKDQSCESEGKHVALLLEHVGLDGFSELLSSSVEWISLDLTCRLLDMFVFFVHVSLFGKLKQWFCIRRGDGSHLKRG